MIETGAVNYRVSRFWITKYNTPTIQLRNKQINKKIQQKLYIYFLHPRISDLLVYSVHE
jgi:hypothetical protein